MSDTARPDAARALSIEEIRSHFPALERTHKGRGVAYFDGPGGTQVPRAVVEAVADYLCRHNANTHWAYPTSAETDEIIERARRCLADFLGAAHDEIVFGANATTLAYHVSRTLGRTLAAGDEIVVTELDHHANVAPWQALARERGIRLRVVRMDTETGALDWGDFESKMSARTRLVAVGAASNALGTINDTARARRLARDAGAYLFVDAVHYAPHRLTDVREIDCDFLVCSAYKFYGPHVGALFCRRDLLESLPFPKLAPAPGYAPEVAETGTQNHEGIAGAAAAVDFLASLASGAAARRERLRAAFDALEARGAELTKRMWQGLSEIEGVKLYGPHPNEPRTPTVACTVRGVKSTDVARALAGRGVFVSHGDFYAATLVERLALGEEGLVRAGCACYTFAEEVERLIEGVREIARSGVSVHERR
ncbi:MAG TPA: cysteine desulfurase-like protein [Pyrinomonadaceae bacterium]|jgi:cysteine desulfurase family protein (TIGR01976 family)|nr:cysteine desulfurase-like protein [Pyrinomonadaceae bacterium]